MNTNNINIEKSVISSIFFDPSLFEEISTDLSSEDFYYPAHKDIYKVFEYLHSKEMPIDEDFVKKELDKIKKFDEEILLDIISTNPITNTGAYVKEIKDSSTRRELATLALEIKHIGDDENIATDEVVDTIQSKLYLITQNSSMSDFKESPEISKNTLEYIKQMKARGNQYLIGLDTGFRDLNKQTTGFGKGDLIILAARPSMGKTAIALNMVLKSLEDNKGVVFFSLEMPSEQLMLRLLSAKTSIPLQKLRVGDLDNKEWENLSNGLNELSSKKLFVDDDGNLNINQLKGKLRKLKSKNPEIDLIVIDYLQLMSGTGSKDRHLEVSEISRGLKLLARELEVPILALSQLNRGVDSRPDKRPMLSDLRESGSIEQDADIIMFVYRDDVYRAKEERDKEAQAKKDGKEFNKTFTEKAEESAELIIGKQRNGPIGTVNLVFQKRFTRFVDKNKNMEKDYMVHDHTSTREQDLPSSLDNVPI